MLLRPLIGLVVLASAVHAEDALATIGPVLVGEESRPECRVAMNMASAAFRSTNALLTWPIPRPDVGLATLVLSRKGRDVSDDSIWADPSVFEKMHIDPVSRRMLPGERTMVAPIVHWQREARGGGRIVAVEQPHSWRGNLYYLFVVDEELPSDAFAQAYLARRGAAPRQPEKEAPALRPVLYKNDWQPLTVLRDEQWGNLWVLRQEDFDPQQAEWQVHASGPQGFAPVCHIVFNPDGIKGLDRLPPAVRRLASLLDEALGPGLNEGTSHPTERIRGQVAHGWATIADRPWALTDTPYNSRAEVEAGLTAWAQGVPARIRLHRRLMNSLQPAETALVRFLVDRFAIAKDDASSFSAYAIDHMLRSYFMFPGGGGYVPGATSVAPWPEDSR